MFLNDYNSFDMSYYKHTITTTKENKIVLKCDDYTEVYFYIPGDCEDNIDNLYSKALKKKENRIKE